MRLLLALLIATGLAATASAHNPSEANELEVALLVDEGTDLIEPYGGYDINAVYAGMAHDGAVGTGPGGDGFYFRTELYGLRENQEVPGPPGQDEWRVTYSFKVDGDEHERYLATTDGHTFSGDFDSILATVDPEPRETHIMRAFVSFASLGVAAGQAVSDLSLVSSVGGDPRDVAPGGIPVPYTGGAQMMPETGPSDVLAAGFTLAPPTQYLDAPVLAGSQGNYTVTLRSALAKTGQHVHFAADPPTGWTFTPLGSMAVSVPANGTVSFVFLATAGTGAEDFVFDITTDVGGRLGGRLMPNGTLEVASARFTPSVPPQESPPAGPLWILAAFGIAMAAGRRR